MCQALGINLVRLEFIRLTSSDPQMSDDAVFGDARTAYISCRFFRCRGFEGVLLSLRRRQRGDGDEGSDDATISVSVLSKLKHRRDGQADGERRK